MTALWILAAACFVWVAYAYIGYPLLLWALHRIDPRPVASADIQPSITIIIAVHNGAEALREKLEATLELEYPGPREVIVASDGSTDATDAIAQDSGVRCREPCYLAPVGQLDPGFG